MMAALGADIIAVDSDEQIDSNPFSRGTEADLARPSRVSRSWGRRIVWAKLVVHADGWRTSWTRLTVAEISRLDVLVAMPGWARSSARGDGGHDLGRDNARRPRGRVETAEGGGKHLVAGGRGGSIVMISGQAGLNRGKNVLAYVAGQHRALCLMWALAIESEEHSIRINDIHLSQHRDGHELDRQ